MKHNLEFIFWAQALDNSSSDYFEKNDKEITEVKNRNELSGKLFAIKQNGETFIKNEGFELTKNKNSILIELDSKEKDEKGRIAPIVCFCEYALLNVDEFCSEFQKTMKNGSGGFADRVKRSFKEENVNAICSELKKKKTKNREINKKLIIGGACLLGLYLIYKFSK